MSAKYRMQNDKNLDLKEMLHDVGQPKENKKKNIQSQQNRSKDLL